MAGNNPGEDKAWEILATLKPEDVCRAAAVSYDAASEHYRITCLGMAFLVSVRERSITGAAEGSIVLLTRLGYFFRLSVLWYLAGAKDITCSGRPVKLQNIKGGEIFTKGSHVLGSPSWKKGVVRYSLDCQTTVYFKSSYIL